MKKLDSSRHSVSVCHMADLDIAHIERTLQSNLPFPSRLDRCVPLAGDASNRRYFRLMVINSPVESIVLMQLADPEGFKASEEAVSQAGEVHELPFVNVHRYLAGLGVPVPALYFYDHAAGLLYLEDLGDRTLAEACATGSPSEVHAWYAHAIAILSRLQCRSLERASSQMNDQCLAFQRAFDVPLLMWEFDHFLEFGIEARFRISLPSNDRQRLREEFHKIAALMAAQPVALTHRDYHSRNIMVQKDRVAIIDFQDALLGPVTYDLASLLRDSYIALDERFIDEMIDLYRANMCAELPGSLQPTILLTDRRAFRCVFDFTSIQRNLKAVGRFVYIDRVKHNAKFLADIPRTLAYVRQNLEKYSELAVLRTLLTPYIPEWQ